MKLRIVVGSGLTVLALGVTGLVAYACIPIATLSLSQTTGAPGSEVQASIHAISGKDAPPVAFHWASVDGTVLATATPTEGGTTASLTIPSSVSQSGDYLIIATQTLASGHETWGMPARAVIHVDVPGSVAKAPANAAVAGSSGPAGLTTGSGLGTAVLVLIAVATAAAGLLVVGGASVLAGRGAPKAEPVTKE